MSLDVPALENRLNDFDPALRREALDALIEAAQAGDIDLPPQTEWHNMHCHSFFSYNGCGFSPTALAWKARTLGLFAVGLVDFDVLDGVEEFLDAASRLHLRATAGIETRVYIPEFARHEINSPGEPGISYHMGVGFTSSSDGDETMLLTMRQLAQRRNRQILERVNTYLAPLSLDYEPEVLPLTPNGNPTERHLCVAYAAKAEKFYPDPADRARFWAKKLGVEHERIASMLDDGPAIQGLIRANTMKKGGVGYVTPDVTTFPELADFNRFAIAAGAVPVITWLDGTSEGEQRMDELIALEMASGAAALNIIPDRNWNISDPAERSRKVDELNKVIDLATRHHLPVIVGTEMNAAGQRLVDDFDADPLKPHLPLFARGARILYAHTRLTTARMGYCSEWAATSFDDAGARNDFFATVGDALAPDQRLPNFPEGGVPASPNTVIDAITAAAP